MAFIWRWRPEPHSDIGKAGQIWGQYRTRLVNWVRYKPKYSSLVFYSPEARFRILKIRNRILVNIKVLGGFIFDFICVPRTNTFYAGWGEPYIDEEETPIIPGTYEGIMSAVFYDSSRNLAEKDERLCSDAPIFIIGLGNNEFLYYGNYKVSFLAENELGRFQYFLSSGGNLPQPVIDLFPWNIQQGSIYPFDFNPNHSYPWQLNLLAVFRVRTVQDKISNDFIIGDYYNSLGINRVVEISRPNYEIKLTLNAFIFTSFEQFTYTEGEDVFTGYILTYRTTAKFDPVITGLPNEVLNNMQDILNVYTYDGSSFTLDSVYTIPYYAATIESAGLYRPAMSNTSPVVWNSTLTEGRAIRFHYPDLIENILGEAIDFSQVIFSKDIYTRTIDTKVVDHSVNQITGYTIQNTQDPNSVYQFSTPVDVVFYGNLGGVIGYAHTSDWVVSYYREEFFPGGFGESERWLIVVVYEISLLAAGTISATGSIPLAIGHDGTDFVEAYITLNNTLTYSDSATLHYAINIGVFNTPTGDSLRTHLQTDKVYNYNFSTLLNGYVLGTDYSFSIRASDPDNQDYRAMDLISSNVVYSGLNTLVIPSMSINEIIHDLDWTRTTGSGSVLETGIVAPSSVPTGTEIFSFSRYAKIKYLDLKYKHLVIDLYDVAGFSIDYEGQTFFTPVPTPVWGALSNEDLSTTTTAKVYIGGELRETKVYAGQLLNQIDRPIKTMWTLDDDELSVNVIKLLFDDASGWPYYGIINNNDGGYIFCSVPLAHERFQPNSEYNFTGEKEYYNAVFGPSAEDENVIELKYNSTSLRGVFNIPEGSPNESYFPIGVF